jgi:U5 small nuclear ribonucleoprotein component
MTVVINKIDRLIFELKIPPADAYLKIKHTLEEINSIILSCTHHLPDPERFKVSPLLGNVVFASGKYGFVFSLKSFSKKYTEKFNMDLEVFSQLMWGDLYYNPKSRKFQKSSSKEAPLRTFVQFILEPMYKLLSSVISYDIAQLSPLLAKLKIYLHNEDFRLDSNHLLKKVCMRYFSGTSCLVDMLV